MKKEDGIRSLDRLSFFVGVTKQDSVEEEITVDCANHRRTGASKKVQQVSN